MSSGTTFVKGYCVHGENKIWRLPSNTECVATIYVLMLIAGFVISYLIQNMDTIPDYAD